MIDFDASKLSLFSKKEIDELHARVVMRERKGKQVPCVKCLVRGKELQLKHEERIRQLWLARLTRDLGYPEKCIRVEYSVTIGSEKKRADIVVLDNSVSSSTSDRQFDEEYIIIETKREEVKEGKDQLRSYCNATGAPIAIWSNGQEMISWYRSEPNHFLEISEIPKSSDSLEDIINKPWTIETLKGIENTSLRSMIRKLENDVLANAGVDVFEEVFKLLFAKMYDEQNAQENNSILRFRDTNSDSEFFDRISDLFNSAKARWRGVFEENDKIKLATNNLRICVRRMEGWLLFNSNLEVIDDAFEYLVAKSSKGEKGQYFTPRWVIDMCVKMLDPKEDETLIDPACGSAGFLIHSIFHVWKKISVRLGNHGMNILADGSKPKVYANYVESKVFGIDFDDKVIRVARCLNLIAGDGQTNVLPLNSLEWNKWSDWRNDETWRDIYASGWSRFRTIMSDSKKKDYRKFKFDVCLANPPFSGAIKQLPILNLYEVSKSNGKQGSSSDRDVLFAERCIDLIRPGGRVAIVLPEGRFNNPSNVSLREYVMDKCRVLAVVSLHSNSFKPHTGIRTGVLLLQKWNDKKKDGPLCKKKSEYDIFFARQEVESVNNRGEKVYVRDSDKFLLDGNQQPVVAHDLFNHDGLTKDGIAEAFSSWAEDQELSFVENSQSGENSSTFFHESSTTAMEYRRFDPKFFLPEYRQLLTKIMEDSNRYRRIKEFSVFNQRGIQPKYVENGDVQVITSGNILDGYLDYRGFGRTSLSQMKLSQFSKAKVRSEDILIYTTGANIGRTALYTGTGNVIASNHVNILRIKEENPTYVAFMLNSQIGKMQVDAFKSGSAQPEIYPGDIENLVIPFLTKDEENEIVKRLLDAEEKRRQSIEAIDEIGNDLQGIFSVEE